MPCNCNSRLDSIMTFLEEMKVEIGFVKTKCIRIEKEILGITPESEANPEALVETTTVRHLVEKLAYDVGVLTKGSNNNARAGALEAEQQKKIEATHKDLHSKLQRATNEKIKDLQLKYDVVTRKTFQEDFSKFLEEFRSKSKKALLATGVASTTVQDMVDEVTRSSPHSDDLYTTHFSTKNKEMTKLIRDQYEKVVKAYAKTSIGRMESYADVGLNTSREFLVKFKLCDDSFAGFQEELLNEFEPINEQIEANRSLVERLTRDYRNIVVRNFNHVFFNRVRISEESETKLKYEVIVSDPQLVPLFVKKLRRNMNDIYDRKGL